ncbi:MAG: decarboxylating 6-phosphogluconate dehydrogenase [Candidatus Diapherotrites archaeon]|uniref:Decarboxylating 6-phosphogluconate dehydrogenase n=1 Tax=Candidatus Iainarchaeum sp. TaxID=3101447 RepID=A0A8T3YJN0_9ARCH|nr:decarboxylating 6-phosphogluconate dehydrogenase [Candidatus Diapherotrites archaeon]
MRIGFIGLGKMGSRMAERLLGQGFEVVLYARRPDSMTALAGKGAVPTGSYREFCERLPAPKMIFLMVTHGKPVDEVINGLGPFLAAGDIIVDCGNSFYKDSIRRAKSLAKRGIHFLDAGTSGGLEGAANGASIMVGGNRQAFDAVEPAFRALAVPGGYAWLGGSGAGHFVKMVHNGIEYSLLQAYGEGYALLEKSKYRLDLREVTRVFRNGSVIRGWLMDLLSQSLASDPKLSRHRGVVGGGGTGKWALDTAKEYKLKMPMLEQAMKARKRSFSKPDFSTKVVAALRSMFGGHEEPKK